MTITEALLFFTICFLFLYLDYRLMRNYMQNECRHSNWFLAMEYVVEDRQSIFPNRSYKVKCECCGKYHKLNIEEYQAFKLEHQVDEKIDYSLSALIFKRLL